MEQSNSRWECAVCGHIHFGASPPTHCPVCGAGKEQFMRQVSSEQEKPKEGSAPKKIAVVGAGIAGFTAASTLRSLSSACEIHLYNEESDLPYYRMNLTRILAGEISSDELPLQKEKWFKDQDIHLHSQCRIIQIEPELKTVTEDTGNRIQFDDLILCSGAKANLPHMFAPLSEQVFTLRSWADLRRLSDRIQNPKEIVCLGGGVLGVETACALSIRGHNVTLAYRGEHLMPSQLNHNAADRLESLLREHNVTLLPNTELNAFSSTPQPVLHLSNGERLMGDLLVLATGIEPCLPDSHPRLPKPCPVDTRMATSYAGIWAAGDNAVIAGRRFGSWGPAQIQGEAAAKAVLGQVTEYVHPIPTCLIKILEPQIISIGDIRRPQEQIEQNRNNYLISLFFKDHRLCGAILINASEYASVVNQQLAQQDDLSTLLRRHPSARDMLDALSHLKGPG